MSDQHDDKLNTQEEQPIGGRDPQHAYSVEEILSEFSSSRGGKRVVPFPAQRPPEDGGPEDGGPEDDAQDAPGPGEDPAAPGRPPDDGVHTAEIIDLPPESLLFELKEKVRALFRRADEYADQMYQQAEPSPEELEAEQYIPGVDREEPPREEERPRRRPRPQRTPPKPPKDIPPADLAARYKKGLASTRVRLWLCLLLALAAGYVSLYAPLPAVAGLEEYALRLLCCAAALAAVSLLCADVIAAGLAGLFTLRPGAETLAALAALITLADTLTMPTLGTRGDTLSCAAPACFVLTFALWGRHLKRRADRLACRTAAQAKEPYLLTVDEAKWSGRPAYCKWSGALRGFGSQIQSPDGAQRVYRVAAPLLLLACLLCALLASVGREKGVQFLWAFSCTLTAAASFSALLVYGLPYQRLSQRLGKAGSALAGWPGAACCGTGSIILTDPDLFPTGAVKLNGIKIFGDFSNEKVVAYTATLVRASRSGLEKPFSDLMKSQNAMYRSAAGIRFHEGGITGIIRNQEVIVGTAAFLHLMNVALPQGLHVKNAVFCAIDGELAGIFALHYAMHEDVAPCLTVLMRNRIAPLLATRDPNLLPSLLGQKFKLPVDKMEFPSVDRRLELSDPEQSHSGVITAVLLREGLGPYSDAAVGARRLRGAVRLGSALSVAGSALGVVLTFYLTFVDAYRSLSPAALLVFLLAWLVPTLFLSDWVTRY